MLRMRPLYVLKNPVLEKPSTALGVGEFRVFFFFFMPVGPEELTLQALSPEQRGYRVFYTRTGLIKQVCKFAGARAIAKSKTRVSQISSSS